MTAPPTWTPPAPPAPPPQGSDAAATAPSASAPLRRLSGGLAANAWWLACVLAILVSMVSVAVLRSSTAASSPSALCPGSSPQFPVVTAGATPSPTPAAASSDSTSTDVTFTDTAVAPGGDITETDVPDPNNDPSAIAFDCAGDVWVAESGNPDRGTAAQLDRIAPDGVLTQFALPPDEHSSGGVSVQQMLLGPDRNLWLTDGAGKRLIRVDPADGTTTSLPVPQGYGPPVSMAAGSDGAVWFAEGGDVDRVGRVTTSGGFSDFALPGRPNGVQPQDLTAGPDGAVWFTSVVDDSIGRIGTNGSVRLMPLPRTGSNPEGITAGGDGALWFSETGFGRVARLSTGGRLDEYQVPRSDPGATAVPRGALAGPDGRVYVSDPGNNAIDVVEGNGSITLHVLPLGRGPGALAAALDGNIWFLERGSGSIGRLRLTGSRSGTYAPITRYATPPPSPSPSG